MAAIVPRGALANLPAWHVAPLARLTSPQKRVPLPLLLRPHRNASSPCLFRFETCRNYASHRRAVSPKASSSVRRPPSSRQAPEVQPLRQQPQQHRVAPSGGDEAKPFFIPYDNLYAQSLAQKPKPTLLYFNQPRNLRSFACAAAGGVVMTVALQGFYYGFFFPSPGIWWLVPWMSLPINGLIFVFGAFLATRKLRSISTIVAEGQSGARTLKLIISGPTGPRLPGTNWNLWKPEVSECALDQVTLKRSILNHQLPLSPKARAKALKLPYESKPMSELSAVGMLVEPMKRLFRWPWNFVKDYILEEGKLGLFVKGKSRIHRWDLDVKNAWMLDDGKSLEALLMRNSLVSERAVGRLVR